MGDVDHELHDLFLGQWVFSAAGAADVIPELVGAPLRGEECYGDEPPVPDREPLPSPDLRE